jgi:hypothetical protein
MSESLPRNSVGASQSRVTCEAITYSLLGSRAGLRRVLLSAAVICDWRSTWSTTLRRRELRGQLYLVVSLVSLHLRILYDDVARGFDVGFFGQ